MNEIKGMHLVYRTLAPVPDYEDYLLSVGTITFSMPEEVPLDFFLTEGCQYPNEDGTVTIRVKLSDFCPDVFADEYKELGLANNLTYFYFLVHHYATCLTEVYTEYVSRDGKRFVPVTLEAAELIFINGKCIDYSDRISAAALLEMAETA